MLQLQTQTMEMKALFGLNLFHGVLQDVKQPCKQLWYGSFAARPIYKRCACAINVTNGSCKIFHFMTSQQFHDLATLCKEFLNQFHLQSSCRQVIKTVLSDDIIQPPDNKNILNASQREEPLEDEQTPWKMR